MESVTLTYEELAERLGIGVDSARIKARRMKRHGWVIQPPNGPGGKARVVIPEGAIPEQLPERSGTARERYDKALPERYTEVLRELQVSRERVERLIIEAGEARVENARLAAELAGKAELVNELRRQMAKLDTEVAELRTPWWAKVLAALRRQG